MFLPNFIKCIHNANNSVVGVVMVTQLRIFGVLQRLALTYLVTALVHVLFAKIQTQVNKK